MKFLVTLSLGVLAAPSTLAIKVGTPGVGKAIASALGPSNSAYGIVPGCAKAEGGSGCYCDGTHPVVEACARSCGCLDKYKPKASTTLRIKIRPGFGPRPSGPKSLALCEVQPVKIACNV